MNKLGVILTSQTMKKIHNFLPWYFNDLSRIYFQVLLMNIDIKLLYI